MPVGAIPTIWWDYPSLFGVCCLQATLKPSQTVTCGILFCESLLGSAHITQTPPHTLHRHPLTHHTDTPSHHRHPSHITQTPPHTSHRHPPHISQTPLTHHRHPSHITQTPPHTSHRHLPHTSHRHPLTHHTDTPSHTTQTPPSHTTQTPERVGSLIPASQQG